MNAKLAAALVDLSDPVTRTRFESDPDGYLAGVDLPDFDKQILRSADRSLLRLHARFGSVTPELLAAVQQGQPTDQMNAGLNMHEHLFEFEHDHDALATSDDICRSFGPHTRVLDP